MANILIFTNVLTIQWSYYGLCLVVCNATVFSSIFYFSWHLEDGSSGMHRVNEKQLSQVKWVLWYYMVSVIPGNVFCFHF